jgi:hypothetical protein
MLVSEDVDDAKIRPVPARRGAERIIRIAALPPDRQRSLAGFGAILPHRLGCAEQLPLL